MSYRPDRVRQPGWDKLRDQRLERDGHRCQLRYVGCQVLATEVDHIVPDYLRKRHVTIDELQSACPHCHGIKSEVERKKAFRDKKKRRYLPREAYPR